MRLDPESTVPRSARAVRVVHTPHPLTLAGQTKAERPPGDTLATLAQAHAVDGLRITIDGREVPAELWPRTTPKPGALVEMRPRPRAPVLAMALNYVAAWVATAIGAAGFWAGVVKGVVTLGGMLLINKLLAPPKRPQPAQLDQSPVFAISNAQNRARPYEMVPLVLGNVRVVLDYVASPYTELQGEDQYFHSLFGVGVGAASYSDVRIGQTAIGNYSGVSLAHRGFAGMADQPIAIRTSVTTIAGGVLDGTNLVPITRATSANTLRIAVDIEATVFAFKSDGNLGDNQYLDFLIDFRELPSGPWFNFLDGSNNQGLGAGAVAGTSRIPWVSTKPIRKSFERQVDPAKLYEVRVYKYTGDVSGGTQTNTAAVSQIKCYRPDSAVLYGAGEIAVSMKASGQLNGAIDQLTAQVQSIQYQLWNGSAWNLTTTSNAGAVLYAFCRGIYNGAGRLIAGYGYADSQLDVESFKAFMLHCQANGFTYNAHVANLVSCDELAEQIARCGMGSLTRHTGRLGVLYFAANQPIESVVNMATMLRGSFGADYYTGQSTDELQVTYADANGGGLPEAKTLRVQSPVAATFANVGSLQLEGVTTEAHAAMLGRFAMAQNVYQRKQVTWGMDAEYLSFQRGSVIALSHDLTQWGYSGRLQAAVNNAGTITLTLDEAVPGTNPNGPSTTRMIGLRLLGETSYRIFSVASFAGESRTLTLTTAWPGGAVLPGSVAGEPALECVWIYDFKASPGLRMRVIEVQPQANDAGANITAVPEPSEFWTYVTSGTYLPPANSSLLDRAPPVVTSLVLTDEWYQVGDTFTAEMSATWAVTGNYARAEVWGRFATNPLAKIADSVTNSATWAVAAGETWQVEIRAFDGVGRAAAVVSASRTVPDRQPPPVPSAFSVLQTKSGTKLATWAMDAPPADLATFEVRFSEGTTSVPWEACAEWGAKDRDARSLERTPPLRAGTYTFQLRALDTQGNQSASATALLTVSDTVYSLFERQPKLRDWQDGERVNCVRELGSLRPVRDRRWQDLGTWAAAGVWSQGNVLTPISYIETIYVGAAPPSYVVSAVPTVRGTPVVDFATSADGSSWSAYAALTGAPTASPWLRLRLTVSSADPQIFDWLIYGGPV